MKKSEPFFSLGESRRTRERSLAILVGALMMGLALFSLHVVSFVHLIIKYGWGRVRSENLRFTSLKPKFVLSNGDEFRTWEALLDGAIVFALMAALMVFIVIPNFHRIVNRKRQ